MFKCQYFYVIVSFVDLPAYSVVFISMATRSRSCPIHGEVGGDSSNKSVAKHGCSIDGNLSNRPSKWPQIDKKIANFRAELAAKRLARSIYLRLSLGMKENFCPRHSVRNPAIKRYLERLNEIFHKNHISLPASSNQVSVSSMLQWVLFHRFNLNQIDVDSELHKREASVVCCL